MDRKGQAEVIATILLVLVVVIAFSGIWVWYMGRYSGVLSDLYREKEKTSMSMKEKMILEKVIFKTGEIDVYLTNVGVEAYVSALYINDTLVYNDDLRLLSDSSTWINVSFNWESDKIYSVKACTSLGNCFEVWTRAP